MQRRSGPSLPQSLLEELDKASGHGSGKRKNGQSKLSRKEARKQDRNNRKQRKADFFSTTRPNTAKRHAETEHADSPPRKRPKTLAEPSAPQPAANKTSSAVSGLKSKSDKKFETKAKPGKLKAKSALEKLAKRSGTGSQISLSKAGAPLRTQQEQEEDAYIAYLESKLGWAKGGRRSNNYGKGLEEDGLDELLRDLDTIEASRSSSTLDESFADEDEMDEEEGDEVGVEDEDEDEDEVEDVDEEEDETEGEGELEDIDESDHGEVSEGTEGAIPEGGYKEWSGFEAEADPVIEPDSDSPVPRPSIPEEKQEKPVPGSRYVPPHLRNREGEEEQKSEEQLKLTRQLKGLLNRMSEQNIASIVDSVEEMYRSHRRHDVTSTLTTLIIEGISSHSILLDAYVVLHAAFVSSLHKLIGLEFAAHFVQNVVASYERHFASFQTAEDVVTNKPDATTEGETQGKECSNLIVLLSELYNFQVVSCVLVYDFIRDLLDGELTEFKVELLLKLLRNSGQQLRTDDPSALKEIIQIVHSKVPDQQNALSSRTRFMIETLSNLKNNKIKKNAANPTADAVDRMKKFLSGISKKRHVLAHEPLRVTLNDLHSAESKGKWWLVGAAWGGDPLVDRQDQIREAAAGRAEPDPTSENVLLKLAKKQGMNTDIRRNIFVVLMSSDDYVDACERLSQLKLTEVQQREIIRVLLHCCGNEKSYNPYYTLVAQQLCNTSHAYKITLQFALWDFLRDLGETNVGGAEVIKNLKDDTVGFDVKKISKTRLRNVARAYGWWIAKDYCTLAILKPVDFTVLKPQTLEFLKQMFIHVFANTQLSTPFLGSDTPDLPTTRNRGSLEEVFIKATRVQALALGLIYFIGQVFGQQEEVEGSNFLKWAAQTALDTLRTGIDIIPTL